MKEEEWLPMRITTNEEPFWIDTCSLQRDLKCKQLTSGLSHSNIKYPHFGLIGPFAPTPALEAPWLAVFLGA